MTLHVAVLARIGSADPSSIEKEFEALASYWQDSAFLRRRNRYKTDCIKKIEGDSKPGKAINQSQLAEYNASSSLLHCMDGWTLLGRAVNAHLRGDADTARHLAYYAELRAAMSLLAAEGIGVFNNKHFVVNGPKKATNVGTKATTHVFAWEALAAWSDLPGASSLVFNVLAPDGRPLAEWLAAFSMTAGLGGLVVKDWIGTWGLDLNRLTADHTARKLSSYRPTALHIGPPLGLDETLNYLSGFWRLAEPLASNGFHSLDSYLLRNALQQKFKAANGGRTTRQAKSLFAHQVRSMLHVLGQFSSQTFDWERFLTGADSPSDPALLTQASGKLAVGSKGHDLQVIARATMLLRLASGAGKRLLRTLPEEERGRLQFWLVPLTERLGISEHGSYPEFSADFWADIAPALERVESWVSDNSPNSLSQHRFIADCAPEAATLTATEMAGIWALGL